VKEEKQRLYKKTTHIQASPYGRRENWQPALLEMSTDEEDDDNDDE
jgi:hypothetical protein